MQSAVKSSTPGSVTEETRGPSELLFCVSTLALSLLGTVNFVLLYLTQFILNAPHSLSPVQSEVIPSLLQLSNIHRHCSFRWNYKQSTRKQWPDVCETWIYRDSVVLILNHQSHLIPHLPFLPHRSLGVVLVTSTAWAIGKYFRSQDVSCRASHAANTAVSPQTALLEPCTNRRYFVLLTVMPLLYCVIYTQGGCRVTKLWNYSRNLVVRGGLNTETAYLVFEEKVSLVSQINFISSLSPTKAFNGLGRLEEIWQRQEVSKLPAAVVCEDTKHFLPWLASPV